MEFLEFLPDCDSLAFGQPSPVFSIQFGQAELTHHSGPELLTALSCVCMVAIFFVFVGHEMMFAVCSRSVSH